MTIKEALNLEKNIEQNIKKELLSSMLNVSKSELVLENDKEISTKKLITYKKYLKKYKKGRPIQYILKKAYFYGYEFYVNKNVLIPRPETETLVYDINKYIKEDFNKKVNILDIGTGSGNIAITLKKLNKESTITATDISKKALKVAKKNAKLNNVDIEFIKSDLLKSVKNKYDILVSNPPYIPFSSKNVEGIVKNNEPKLALYASDNGLYYYKEILKDAKKVLNKKNIIAFETGENEHQAIINISKKYFPKAKIIAKKDYNDFERYIFIINR